MGPAHDGRTTDTDTGPGSRRTGRRTYLSACASASIAAIGGCSRLTGPDSRAPPEELAPPDVLGSTHVNGYYNFRETDYLNEGAARLQEMGTNVIRVWDNQLQRYYPYNSDWPGADGRVADFDSVTDVYRHRYFRALFDRPFSTFVLTSYARSTPGLQTHYWLDGVSEEQYAATVEEYEAAARYLSREYRGTGSVFVIQHWEGDWSLLNDEFDPEREPTEQACERMRRWLRARQEGIERGRRAVDSDVAVVHATSVNRVYDAMAEGRRRSITHVVPEVDVDMVAYSAYDVLYELLNQRVDTDLIREVLEFVHERTPEPSPYVETILTPEQTNVYVGEFGLPQNVDWLLDDLAVRLFDLLTETALEWGARWALFWQLYCNEPKPHDVYVRSRPPTNEDMKGFWLIRTDGSDAPARPFFESALDRDVTY